MSTARRTAITLVSVVAVVVAVLRLANPSVREPVFDGRPLSYYLDKQTYGELRTERDARESIRDFGTNAVPSLIEILNARESRFKAKLRGVLQSQPLIRFHSTPLSVRQRQAAL